MEKNKVVGYGIAGIVLVVAVVGYFAGWFTGMAPGARNGGTGGGTPASPTRSAVPPNVVVPGQNATSGVPEGFAVPKVVIPAAPGVTSNLRVFDIKGEKGKFVPSTVAAYAGDVVHVNFTAVDKAYDITFPDYGMKQTAAKGETKVLEFQAAATGKFAYYCDSCGGLNSSAVGYIIIAPKQ